MIQQKIILLTGFEPFGGSSVNPSIKACKLLMNEIYNGYTVKVEEIPLRFKEIKPIIEKKFHTKVEIILEKDSNVKKAAQALPGKPAIIIS